MDRADAIIVGGGIAGLAVAHHLTRAGVRRVCLLEREPLLASHSSGRNAAIFRPLDCVPGVTELAGRSRMLLDALFAESGDTWLDRTGLLFVAPYARRLDGLKAVARRCGVPYEILRRADVQLAVPTLAGGEAAWGLMVPDAGVLDGHAIVTLLARSVRAAGARVVPGAGVRCVRASSARVEGVELESGERLAADVVVIAAGAWASSLGASCGAALPLTPLRRHLAQLDVALARTSPIVWGTTDHVYFRPESGGALASPCDEQPWPPGVPPVAAAALERLAHKLACLAPALGRGRVRRAWACLRTSAPDRKAVAGEDPRIRGLFWLAGLVGYGMTAGMAAGEIVAELICGRAHSLAAQLSPARLLRECAPPVSPAHA